MTTDHNIPGPPTTAPAAPVDAREPEGRPDHTDPAIGASEPQDEAALREWGGLAPDTVILVPAVASAAPMRLPTQVWAMLVVAADIVTDTERDRAGEVALFAGEWVPEQPPAELYDGDLLVRLTPPAEPTYPLPRDHTVDVEMLLAYHGRWQHVGQWCGVDDHWPRLVAPTAAAMMSLHTAAAEAVIPRKATPSTTAPPTPSAYGGVSDLLEAGLVNAVVVEPLGAHRSTRCSRRTPWPQVLFSTARHGRTQPRTRPGRQGRAAVQGAPPWRSAQA